MSMIATAVKHLMAAGVTGDDLLRAIEEMEADMARDPVAEKRRAYDRERKRKAKRSTGIPPESAESTESAEFRDPPNDIYSNPPEPRVSNDTLPPLADRVVSAWNEMAKASGLPQSRSLNPDRLAALRKRVRESGEPAVFEAIRNLGLSSFHCGANDRGWKADLGWLLKSPEKFQKMLEATPESARPPSPSNLASLLDQAKRYRPKDQAA